MVKKNGKKIDFVSKNPKFLENIFGNLNFWSILCKLWYNCKIAELYYV